MASAEAIAVYCFAFLILIVYTADAVVQWRNPQARSRKYLLIQLFTIMTFFVTELVLIVLSQQNPEEAREAMLHSLQGLSLLQGLIIEAMIASRLYLGTHPFDLGLFWWNRFPWLRFQKCFPWVLLSTYSIAMALGCTAFVWILQDQNVYKGRIFVVTAVSISHCFLACFSLRRIHDAFKPGVRMPLGYYVLCFNLASAPASVLVLLCSDITTFLLGETSICFISNGLWVFLLLYNFEIKGRKPSESTGEADETGHWKRLGSDGSTNSNARSIVLQHDA